MAYSKQIHQRLREGFTGQANNPPCEKIINPHRTNTTASDFGQNNGSDMARTRRRRIWKSNITAWNQRDQEVITEINLRNSIERKWYY